MLRQMWFYPLVLCMVLLMSASAMAQAQGGGGGRGGFGGQGADGGGGGRGRGGRGGIEGQMTQIREALAATDEEWTVLEPKVMAVLTARNEVNSGARGGFGRGGRGRGGRGGAPQTPESALARAMEALRDALANPASNNDLINQRLLAVRDARARAEASLETAQKSLKDLLTPRQEATMVSLGFLP